MKAVKRKDIHPIKMYTNPIKDIVNAGYRIINQDGYIYEYIGIGWIKCEKADMIDYNNIPQLID